MNDKIINLVNHGMTYAEAGEFCRQQREIGQYIKNSNEVSIVKVRGTIITYGSKAEI